MYRSHFFAIISLIMMAVMSRFLPHPPNFTSMKAIALFSVFYLGNFRCSLFVVFASLLLSDMVLGFHTSMPFVYLSFGLIAWIGQRATVNNVPLYLTTSSLLFFIVTNFGVWMTDSLYPKTLEGLGLCYFAALPFLVNALLGDLFYGVVIFGGYSLTHKFISFIKSKSQVT